MKTKGLGPAWIELAEELQQRLRALDPPGEVLSAGTDATGLLRFRVRLQQETRAAGRTLVRSYEQRAMRLCELCGGAGSIRGGAIVTVRCEQCAGGQP